MLKFFLLTTKHILLLCCLILCAFLFFPAQPVQAVAPLVNTSSLTTATQPSTERHIITTSDGTIHAFINTGTQATSCSGTPAGLTWLYSTNGGTSWTCGANFNTAITLFASVASDSSDNLYVTYSVAANGASASNDVFYRKLTKGSGATWTVGSEQTVLDASASIGYSYAVIEKEATNDRLWLAVRYFDATNYQVPVYYSSDVSDNPSWTISATLDTAGTQSAAHWPSIAKFGSKLAVTYTNNSQLSQVRMRNDSDGLTSWGPEYSPSSAAISTPTFYLLGSSTGNMYLLRNRSNSIEVIYFNSNTWIFSSLSASAVSSGYISGSTDGVNLWIVYGDATGIATGVSASSRLIYRKCTPTYLSVNCENITSINSYQDFFNQVWLYNGSTYEDLTTAASNTTGADLKHSVSNSIIKAIGDTAYFGQTQQFDGFSIAISTVGTTGVATWEYCSAVDGSGACTTWSTLTFSTSNGTSLNTTAYGAFTVPGDWAAAKVNGESVAKYYIRARATTAFTVGPIGTQAFSANQILWASVIPSPASNTVYAIWTENAIANTKVRSGSFSATAQPPAASADLMPVVGYSSTNNSTQTSTQKRLVRTSDGTLHMFYQAGTLPACGNSVSSLNLPALNWLSSADDGATWTCRGQLNSDSTVNFYFASATTDTSDNIYVVYSPVANTGGTTKNVYYRKITYNGSSSWSLGTEQTLLSGTATVGYSYATIEKETTNNRLWVAVRYYDGTNYQVPVYYSSDLSGAPTWTQSIANLGTAGTSTTGHMNSMTAFGSRIGVMYLDNSGTAKWRYRNDSDGLTTWTTEMVPNTTGTVVALGGSTYTIQGTPDGRVFFALNNGNIQLFYFNGTNWGTPTQLTNLGGSSFVSLATDNTNVWLSWAESSGLSGSLPGSRRIVYRKCAAPYDLGNCDATSNRVVPYHDVFDKVWTYTGGSTYTDVTTAAGNTTGSDTTTFSAVGDVMYFGKTTKFDAWGSSLTTNGVGGAVAWEYWNGANWVPISNMLLGSSTNLSGNGGYFTFTPNTDWAATTVNGESTSYYYIRARVIVAYTTAPVATQFAAIPFVSFGNIIKNPYSNSIRMLWGENSAAPIRVRTTSVAVTTGTPSTASAADLEPAVVSHLANTAIIPLGPRIARTSDGVLHQVVAAGNYLSVCNGSQVAGGLLYFSSTDNGATWTCKAQLGTQNVGASLVTDSNDNLYVAYGSTGSGTAADIFYRKITATGGSTWSVGAEQIMMDSVSASTSYAWQSIVVADSRIWAAARYFDGTNYQVSVYYSSDLSTTPTWTVSQQALDTPNSSNGAVKHYASIARYGDKVGVVMNYFGGNTGGLQWRWRSDSDPLASWNTETYAFPFALGLQSQPGFEAVGTSNGHVFLVSGLDSNTSAIYFMHYNGSTWEEPIELTGTSFNGTMTLAASDDTAWIFYPDTTNISPGLTSFHRIVYKKCVAPFLAENCDTTATPVNSDTGLFDKVWSQVSGSYTNVTTAAGNPLAADTQMVTSVGDEMYFGKSSKFDAISYDLSTLGVAGKLAWEYWNGSAWVAMNTYLSWANSSFAADGHFTFLPNSDWQTTSVNGEGSSYYYIRARVTTAFTTSPVATQFLAMPLKGSYSAVPYSSNNTLFLTWLENSAVPYRARFKTLSGTTLGTGTSSSSGSGENSASTDSSEWWNNAWAWRKQLFFNNTEGNLGTSGETLTNFPVLIKLTSANFDFSRANSSGQDLRFVDSDNATSLPYEIEKWDSANQEATVWVKVPEINANVNTDSIYMYYGNPSASDAQTETSTWDSSFASVWHMDEAGDTIDDSTANDHIGYKLATTQPTQTTGFLGNGQQFNGANNDNIAVPGMLGQAVPVTFSFWAKPGSERACSEGIFDTAPNAAGTLRNFSYSCSYGTGGTETTFEWHGSNPDVRSVLTKNEWVHYTVVASYDGTRHLKLYKNGVLTQSADGTSASTFAWTTLRIGSVNGGVVNPSNNGNNFYGSLDEFRISNVVRSASWIAADYKSQNNQFVNFAGDDVNPAGSFSIGSSVSQGENGGLRISGTINSSKSEFVLTGVQCSVNGGAYREAKATDGSFNTTKEDFYFDFKQTDNDWKGDGYSIRCQALRDGKAILDKLFFFTPITVQSPGQNESVAAPIPTFTFSVLKQPRILAESLQKFQIEIRRGGPLSTADWETYIDEIPLAQDSSKTEDSWENERIKVSYTNGLSTYQVTSKLLPLSGRYSWRVVAVDKSGHRTYSDQQTFSVQGSTAGDFAYNPAFPLTLYSVTGLGNINISTFWPGKVKPSYTLYTTTPTLYGIAFANSKITLEISEQGCKEKCSKTLTTTTGLNSRFGLNIPKGTFQAGKKYLVTLSAARGDLYTELPSFTFSVQPSAARGFLNSATSTAKDLLQNPSTLRQPAVQVKPSPTPKAEPKTTESQPAAKRCILWWCF